MMCVLMQTDGGGQMELCFIANAIVPPRGISGGDKRFIELAKRFVQDARVIVVTPGLGKEVCAGEGLRCEYRILPIGLIEKIFYALAGTPVDKLAFIGLYILRSIAALLVLPKMSGEAVVYATSDYLPDVSSALWMRWMQKNVRFVGMVYHMLDRPGVRKGFWLTNAFAYYAQRLSHVALLRYADAIFVDNPTVVDGIGPNAAQRKKIHVVDAGIDLDEIESVQAPKKESRACFMGRIHQSKGIFDLLEMWPRVRDGGKMPELVMIGAGSADVARKFDGEVVKKGLAGSVKRLGFVKSREDVIRAIKSSKVFVLPSHEEGWGIVLCEAMACGVPAVAYDLPAFGHVFGDALVRVPVGDVGKFAEAVNRLLNDDAYYAEMKKRGLAVVKKYNWGEVAQREYVILQKLFE